ncbi:MAG: hypothetical protein ACUVRK_08875 [Spirochaetota bacterium]
MNLKNNLYKRTLFCYEESLALLGGMWEMGVTLGVLPPQDPWEGIDVDIKVARILNCLKKK